MAAQDNPDGPQAETSAQLVDQDSEGCDWRRRGRTKGSYMAVVALGTANATMT